MDELSGHIRPATAHGWLRRPELDEYDQNAWELPDGTLCMTPCEGNLYVADKSICDWIRSQ
jgi:hypothetical protein